MVGVSGGVGEGRGVVVLDAAPAVRNRPVHRCHNMIANRAVVNAGFIGSFFTDIHSMVNKEDNSCRDALHRTGSATLERVTSHTTSLNYGTVMNVSLSCRAMKGDKSVLVMAYDKATIVVWILQLCGEAGRT